MLNVPQITSRLADMSDAQLAQYARLNKDDPYILPLAASEYKRRQQLRSQAQAGQNAPTATVADQALSEMSQDTLPEDVGIGALPAQNIATMAEGGIAGYAEGDLVGGTTIPKDVQAARDEVRYKILMDELKDAEARAKAGDPRAAADAAALQREIRNMLPKGKAEKAAAPKPEKQGIAAVAPQAGGLYSDPETGIRVGGRPVYLSDTDHDRNSGPQLSGSGGTGSVFRIPLPVRRL